MRLSNSRVLITGGSGFIGSHIVRRLLTENDITVYDVNIDMPLSDLRTQNRGELNIVQGDVTDGEHLRETMAGHDVVIHAAALAGVGAVTHHPLDTLRVNVLGTMTVLDAASAAPSLRRVLCLSTSEVTGQLAYKIPEAMGTTIGPAGETRWTYAAGKAVGEHFALAYHHEVGLPATVLRPFNVYGPDQVGEGAVKNFVLAALSGQDLVVHGDGDEIRSWTYVGDMAEAVEIACTRDEAIGQVFNIGNPDATLTTSDLARRIIELSGSRSKVRHEKRSGPAVSIRVPHVEKAFELVGFKATTDLTAGLVRTIDAFRQQKS